MPTNCNKSFEETCELSQTDRGNCKFSIPRTGLCSFVEPESIEVEDTCCGCDPGECEIELCMPEDGEDDARAF
jgi:hypothetical protein